jgi:hypothetical protein
MMEKLLQSKENGRTLTTSSFFQKSKKVDAFFQPKLSIGPVDDVYEREADAVADKVVSSGTSPIQAKISPIVQRKCSHCEEEELQRKDAGENKSLSHAPAIVSGVIGSGGNKMDGGTKSFMESRFGYDFGNVKIHTDTVAAKSAQSINALAYTSGNSIVFNEGQYNPSTPNGQKLLAHELTHTIQQGAAKSLPIQRQAAPARRRTIWLNIGFDSSAVADTATMQRLRASIAAEKAAIANCCSARNRDCDVDVKALFDWNRVNKPAPTDGDYDSDVPADRTLRDNNIANINTGRAGGIRMLVTASTLSQTWQGARIFANANSANNGLIWNVNTALDQTLSHETGHIGGYSGGDIDGGQHSSDLDNIMSGGDRHAGALPDDNWCEHVDTLAV